MVTKLVRYTAEQAKSVVGNSDVERVAAMDDDSICQAAKKDPDSALPTQDELKQFKRATPKGGGVYSIIKTGSF